jgi:hypothetical protein
VVPLAGRVALAPQSAIKKPTTKASAQDRTRNITNYD